MGGTYDLPLVMWFGNFDLRITVHVIDAARPQSLVALFRGGPYGDRIIIWDDGSCEQLMEVKESYESIEVWFLQFFPLLVPDLSSSTKYK